MSILLRQLSKRTYSLTQQETFLRRIIPLNLNNFRPGGDHCHWTHSQSQNHRFRLGTRNHAGSERGEEVQDLERSLITAMTDAVKLREILKLARISRTLIENTSTEEEVEKMTKERSKCLFCKIVDGVDESSAKNIIYEDDELIILPDIHPAAKYHLLVITKEHIKDAKGLSGSHIGLLNRLVEAGRKALISQVKGDVMKKSELEKPPKLESSESSPSHGENESEAGSSSTTTPSENSEIEIPKTLMGFHWPPFQTVSHVHLHVIAPADSMGFVSRFLFRPNSFWFVSPDYVRERLEKLKSEEKQVTDTQN